MTKKFKINVRVLISQEGDYFVAYCPELDLSSYGRAEAAAKKSFEQALKIFVKETERKGTLEKVILGLGWTLKQKPTPKYQPPELSAKNKRAVRSRSVRLTRTSVPISYTTV
ncbi:hypothetical protein HZB60_11985 [candidate division KSB1 bacterium]|nr:hypothetical protein [candidate division KSB1 bacterium]